MAHHEIPYTDAEALAAAVQAGAITNGVTFAPTHDAVFDVMTTANAAIAKALLTTLGDMIRRGAAVPERFGIGAAGDVLTVVAGVPTWQAPAGGATLVIAETEVFNGNTPTSWTDLDLSGTIGEQATFVVLKVLPSDNFDRIAFRKNGDTDEFYSVDLDWSSCAFIYGRAGIYQVVLVFTDDVGKIEWIAQDSHTAVIDIMGYIK